MTSVCDRLAGAGELALRAQGLDGERLQKISYAIAHQYCAEKNAGLDSRIDDLAQHIALTVTRRALRYDPSKSGADYSFISYCFDIGHTACVDFFRSKGNGFQDRRYYGPEVRVSLVGHAVEDIALEDNTLDDDGHAPSHHWRQAAHLLETPFMGWQTVTERRVLAWTRAAEEVGLTLDEFVARAADVYANAIDIPEAA